MNFSYCLEKPFVAFTVVKFIRKLGNDSIIICSDRLLKPCIIQVMVKGKLLCDDLPVHVNDMVKIKLFDILLLKKSFHLLCARPYAEDFTYMTSFNLHNSFRSKQASSSLYSEEVMEALRG